MSELVGSSDWKPRVLVTRASGQASALAEELRRLGAEPISVPTIEIVHPDSFGPLDAAIADLNQFDWWLFTSANAVRAFTDRAERFRVDLSSFERKVSAIGSATARALEAIGLTVHLVPETAVAESMAESLVPFARKAGGEPTRFLLIRAQEGRDHLPETLRAKGGDVTVVAAYKTQVPEDGIAALRECLKDPAAYPDGLTLTSSSAARNFFDLLTAAGLSLEKRTGIASIGPITSATLRELGRAPDAEAPEASVQALARTIVEFLRRRREANP